MSGVGFRDLGTGDRSLSMLGYNLIAGICVSCSTFNCWVLFKLIVFIAFLIIEQADRGFVTRGCRESRALRAKLAGFDLVGREFVANLC